MVLNNKVPPFSGFGRAGRLVLLVAAGVFLGSLHAEENENQPPEPATRFARSIRASSPDFMVVTAHPLATEAAAAMIRAGGSAVDAAVAGQMVLTLVEPQSSGIGGGAFLLHFDGRTVRAFDGRETAPMAVEENLFLKEDGSPMRFQDAVVGGRAVGVPGVLRLLELAHHRYGRLPWESLFAPAIHLAEQGFPVSPRLHALLEKGKNQMADPTARTYFYREDGSPWPIGHLLKNPALASTFRQLAKDGVDVFYQGALASDIVAKVRQYPGNPGLLSESDLAEYWARSREPVCVRHGGNRVCGFPPPSSGGIAVGQMLGVLERKLIASQPPKMVNDALQPTVGAVHLFSEAGRLAFADRSTYIADPAFVRIPSGLLDPSYVDQRARLIGEKSMGKAESGRPPGATAVAGDATDERPATSHLSIVDRQGQAVALTTTIESGFGARLMVHGFLLNNQLTDFSFLPRENGRPVANRVEPGKRPRSAMAPTMVLDSSGRLKGVIGSPGGAWIINYVTKTLVGVLDWGLQIQDAIALPNFGSRNGPTELEAGQVAPDLAAELAARGHEVVLRDMPSGINGILRTPEGWTGAADPRREGSALGR